MGDLKDISSGTEQIRLVPVVSSLFINGNNSVLIFCTALYPLCGVESSLNDCRCCLPSSTQVKGADGSNSLV